MKKLLLGSAILTVFLFSCSKDDDPAPGPAEKYMNITAGSTWNYSVTDLNNAANNSTYVLTSLNRDSAAAGKSYHVFSNSDGGNEYYNITGNDYYSLRALPLGVSDTILENLYLKDNLSANSTWSQDYSLNFGIPVTVTVTNKINATGLSKTVGANAYTNVIDVVTTISAPAITTIPGSSLTTDIHSYYAPKVGMIETDAKIDIVVPGFIDQHVNTQTKLTSSNIL